MNAEVKAYAAGFLVDRTWIRSHSVTSIWFDRDEYGWTITLGLGGTNFVIEYDDEALANKAHEMILTWVSFS